MERERERERKTAHRIKRRKWSRHDDHTSVQSAQQFCLTDFKEPMYPFHIVHKLQCTIPDSLRLDSQFLGTAKAATQHWFLFGVKIIHKRQENTIRSITLLRINHFFGILRYFVHYDYCIISSFDFRRQKNLRPKSSRRGVKATCVVHMKPYICALQQSRNVLASHRNHSQIECDGIVRASVLTTTIFVNFSYFVRNTRSAKNKCAKKK